MISQIEAFFHKQKAAYLDILCEMGGHGAASAPILTPKRCRELIEEAEEGGYVFTRELREQGKLGARVYQELDTCKDFPDRKSVV